MADLAVGTAKPFCFTAPYERLALLNIDWQRDFLEPGGFGDSLGNQVSLLQAALGPAAALLQAAREAGMPVFHTLEAHKPDLSDLPPAKKRRCSAIGEVLDEKRGRVLIEGEPGNAIVKQMAPVEGEVVIHKPGKGAFWNTDLEAELKRLGITHLLVTGVTTEVCVQTTIREANDRGYDCLLVTDATESYFPEFKEATMKMIVAQGGIAGWTASTAEVIPAIQAVAPILSKPPNSHGPTQLVRKASCSFRTTLLAVSGTLQCGFELRRNLDHPEMQAIFLGSAVVRGVKAYLDIKEPGSREYVAAPGFARVNPANVITGERCDANLYAVYLVHEAVVTRALIGEFYIQAISNIHRGMSGFICHSPTRFRTNAFAQLGCSGIPPKHVSPFPSLVGEPRYLAIAPDAVRVDLTAAATSAAVRKFLIAAASGLPGASQHVGELTEASILTVVSTYHAPTFVPLDPMEDQPAGVDYKLTSFPEGLAAFANLPVSQVRVPGALDSALRKAESQFGRDIPTATRSCLATGPTEQVPSSEPWRPRLAALYSADELRMLAVAAGFSSGEHGTELAKLVKD